MLLIDNRLKLFPKDVFLYMLNMCHWSWAGDLPEDVLRPDEDEEEEDDDDEEEDSHGGNGSFSQWGGSALACLCERRLHDFFASCFDVTARVVLSFNAAHFSDSCISIARASLTALLKRSCSRWTILHCRSCSTFPHASDAG